MIPETAENRLKRLRMRSWRRGTKEMDMILGPFADKDLGKLGAQDLDLYEVLQGENDQDLYLWFSGRCETPARFRALVATIKNSVGII